MIDHLPGPESQTYICCRLILEGTALGLVLIAFGIDVNVFQVRAAFGARSIAGGLPGTPGGLSVTEAGLVFILSAYGFPEATTVAPVLIYRIVSYWLPRPQGACRRDDLSGRRRRRPPPRSITRDNLKYPRAMPETIVFSLPNQDGETVSSKDFEGKTSGHVLLSGRHDARVYHGVVTSGTATRSSARRVTR